MRDPVYPIFCAIGAVLTVLPLPWHWQARNTGTLIYVGWTFTGCVVFLINSLIWAGNINDIAPIWCDISSRFVIALSIGLPASSLCIQRRLYRIAAMKEVSILRDTRKRDCIIELLIGVGLPLLVVVLSYVVQPARYVIVEDIGCWPSGTNMIISVFMVRMWSVVVSFAAVVYAGFILRAFIQTRRQFSRALSESGTDLNLSRFFRLMALASTDMAFSLPLSLYFLLYNLLFQEIEPWISWNETHKHIHEVWTMSRVETLSVPGLQTSFDLNRWAIPGCAFLFFMFFGLSSEAVNQYKLIFWRLASQFGFKPSEPKLHTTSWPRRLVRRGLSNAQTDTTRALTASTLIGTSISTSVVVDSSDEKMDIREEGKLTDAKTKHLEGQA